MEMNCPQCHQWRNGGREGGEFRSTVGRSNSRKKALIPIPKGGQTEEADVTVQCNAGWIEGYGMLQNPVTYILYLLSLNEVPDTSNMVHMCSEMLEGWKVKPKMHAQLFPLMRLMRSLLLCRAS